MHQVQEDIAELSDGLVLDAEEPVSEENKSRKDGLMKLFPRGPARVILFIDDLDRCPPPRVVEVLEATQLLLKTPLFVVVLGLDTRYATRALEKEYKEILQHDGDPSGMDYIEKIIQLPYRVRPIERKGLETFLRDQMKPLEQEPELLEVEKPGPAEAAGPQAQKPPESAPTVKPETAEEAGSMEKPSAPEGGGSEPPPPTKVIKELPPSVVRFTQEDFRDVQAACSRIKLTPRSVKRLVNVMKLMEVFWFRTLETDRGRPVKQSVIALLALAAAYPEVMVEVFSQMEPLFDDANYLEKSLGDFLGDLKPETLEFSGPGQGVLNWQFKKFQQDIQALGSLQVPGTDASMDFLGTTFDTMKIETFNMVRSFSFIGDPAYTLENTDGESTAAD